VRDGDSRGSARGSGDDTHREETLLGLATRQVLTLLNCIDYLVLSLITDYLLRIK